MKKKITTSCIIIALSFISLGFSVRAATLEDVKEAVVSGKGKIVHPKIYRELTDEEREARKDWPDKIDKTSREMTKEEADEYFSSLTNIKLKIIPTSFLLKHTIIFNTLLRS